MNGGGVPLTPLPIDPFVPGVRACLDERRACVLTAGPGAGKTTRVPPALLDAGRVLVLQPRRVAVRAVAARIAHERGWTLGQEVGWHVRFERRFTDATRLLVVTEGILTARLQHDPLLSDVATVVLDEFHERSIHCDVGLALARQAWLARSDLRLLVMSATLDAAPVAHYLDDCPMIAVPGAPHPLEVEYAPDESVGAAVRSLLPRTTGQVLCFLPGSREIERARQDLAATGPTNLEAVPLHGSLDGDAQDAAIRPSDRRRVILATNIAETSLTVPGVSVVIDTGLVKMARYDAARGVDALTLERVTADSAAQRAGRAARLGPGVVRRLWDARDRLRPAREPEIARVDLAGPALDVIAWGADPRHFAWFEAPPPGALDVALALLRRLGAIADRAGRLEVTPVGRQLLRIPAHVRIARILLEGRGASNVAAACALLSEGRGRGSGSVATTCDLLHELDRFEQQPPHVQRVAREFERVARYGLEPTTPATRPATGATEVDLRRALFAGYGDRLAKRRQGSPDRVTLASGHGAVLGRESGVRDGTYLVALDVSAAAANGVAEARIHTASLVEASWIVPTTIGTEHRLDGASGRVKAWRVARYDALILTETPIAADPEVAAALLADAWRASPPSEQDAQLIRRIRFAGLEVDLPTLVRRAAGAARGLGDLALAAQLPYDVTRNLARLAPATLVVPSGRSTALRYEDDGTVGASVKLQELFGLADSPVLGPARVPVTFQLLAPNGRTVQTTQDLGNFWRSTYQDVRKELRGRYPKHPWPEDPWTATATHRTTRFRAK